MNLLTSAIETVERLPMPDRVTRAGIGFLVERTRRRLRGMNPERERHFLREMEQMPIAVHTEAANAQHYELPPEFFTAVLGPHRKYSCCLFSEATTSLAEAERAALAETVSRAGIEAGQNILELGCGWGSLSLYLAGNFPDCRITSVSNSQSQRAFIEAEASRRGFGNLTVVTADMNAFRTDETFDRIVSVEMFEHMSNWRALMTRARGWLRPEGRLFLHVFTHRSGLYRFDHADTTDWIAQHFFTGGIMPSQTLPHRFPDLFTVEAEWRWNGEHYARTAQEWLRNFDANGATIGPIMQRVYGAKAALWTRRWRLFFLATAGLFGHARGEEWGVGHFRLMPTAPLTPAAAAESGGTAST
jgi:cyclopropane-fatty-acyl-phospholipid synthase